MQSTYNPNTNTHVISSNANVDPSQYGQYVQFPGQPAQLDASAMAAIQTPPQQHDAPGAVSAPNCDCGQPAFQGTCGPNSKNPGAVFYNCWMSALKPWQDYKDKKCKFFKFADPNLDGERKKKFEENKQTVTKKQNEINDKLDAILNLLQMQNAPNMASSSQFVNPQN